MSPVRRRPAPSPRGLLGREGEARAAALLESLGYRIAARNARSDRVEIDLVAVRGSLVVFVEVKTRRSSACGAAEEAVDARKRARLVRGAAAWLHDQGVRAGRVRFDVVTCTPDPRAPGGWRVRHWPGAFDASG
jgi:putative endonuclease